MKKNRNLCILSTMIVFIAVVIVILLMVVKMLFSTAWDRAAVNSDVVSNSSSASGIDIGDTSKFSAGISNINDLSEPEESASDRAARLSKTFSEVLEGTWIDQNDNVRRFSEDGYRVLFADGSDVSGTAEIVQDTEYGSVVLRTDNLVEGSIDYSIDVIDNDSIILWSFDKDHPDLNLRR